jgi:hypothetical protein
MTSDNISGCFREMRFDSGSCKLWWGGGFGGDGAIYSSIDGSGDAYPIGECDNASRVIKYVVLLGYRHSHYNLVDMRIHDINSVAHPNQTISLRGFQRP